MDVVEEVVLEVVLEVEVVEEDVEVDVVLVAVAVVDGGIVGVGEPGTAGVATTGTVATGVAFVVGVLTVGVTVGVLTVGVTVGMMVLGAAGAVGAVVVVGSGGASITGVSSADVAGAGIEITSGTVVGGSASGNAVRGPAASTTVEPPSMTGGWSNTPPARRAPAVAATLAAAPATGLTGTRPTSGSWVSHDSGPIARRSRPSEMFRNARTGRGSNCVPAQRASSARPSTAPFASLYERTLVITSKTSATDTIRAARLIWSPAIPFG